MASLALPQGLRGRHVLNVAPDSVLRDGLTQLGRGAPRPCRGPSASTSARAASTSGGKSTSPHSSPWMSSVHTSPSCARWWITRRYQMVVPSAGPHRLLDRLAEPLGAAVAEREQADQFGVDAVADPLADRPQPAVVVHDHLHVVVVIAVLAVDGDADAGLRVGRPPAPSARSTPTCRRSTPGNRRPAPRAP